MYNPKPIDTSDIILPDDLLALTESIKTTPQLVPYSDLPEEEKEYDRNTALETLKLIIKLGYEISNNHNQ